MQASAFTEKSGFACAGAGWVLRLVRAPNTSLSTHTFCCSPGFDFQELQVSSTVCTCSIFDIVLFARVLAAVWCLFAVIAGSV